MDIPFVIHELKLIFAECHRTDSLSAGRYIQPRRKANLPTCQPASHQATRPTRLCCPRLDLDLHFTDKFQKDPPRANMNFLLCLCQAPDLELFCLVPTAQESGQPFTANHMSLNTSPGQAWPIKTLQEGGELEMMLPPALVSSTSILSRSPSCAPPISCAACFALLYISFPCACIVRFHVGPWYHAGIYSYSSSPPSSAQSSSSRGWGDMAAGTFNR